MPRTSTLIAILACISLVAIQLSGLHMHANANENSDGLHLTHRHFVATQDHYHHGSSEAHNHSAGTDFALTEQLSTSGTKLIPLLILIVIAALLGLRLHTQLRSSPTQSEKVRHRERWRPPLRAPPISL